MDNVYNNDDTFLNSFFFHNIYKLSISKDFLIISCSKENFNNIYCDFFTSNGLFKINLLTGEEQFSYMDDKYNCISCIDILPDKNLFITGYIEDINEPSNPVFKLWNINEKKPIKCYYSKKPYTNCVKFLKNSSLFISNELNNYINIWRFNKKYCIKKIKSEDTNYINDLIVSNNDKYIFYITEDKYFKKFCFKTIKNIFTIKNDYHPNCISLNNNKIYVGFEKGIIKQFSEDGDILNVFDKFNKECIQFITFNNKSILCSTIFGNIYQFSIKNNNCFQYYGHSGKVFSLDIFKNNNQKNLIVSNHNSLNKWNIPGYTSDFIKTYLLCLNKTNLNQDCINVISQNIGILDNKFNLNDNLIL
jgi:hypothetical protein